MLLIVVIRECLFTRPVDIYSSIANLYTINIIQLNYLIHDGFSKQKIFSRSNNYNDST